MKKIFSRQIFLNLKDHFPKTPKSLSTPGKIWRTRRVIFPYRETPTLLGQVPPSGWVLSVCQRTLLLPLTFRTHPVQKESAVRQHPQWRVSWLFKGCVFFAAFVQ